MDLWGKDGKIIQAGVFLGGLGIFMSSILFIFMLSGILFSSGSYAAPTLSAGCIDGELTIYAAKDVDKIVVTDSSGKEYCREDSLKANNQSLCVVPTSASYVVKSGEIQQVVRCDPQQPVFIQQSGFGGD